ncbi:MAG: hypothetical protein HXS40_09375 [Theionarchaea archaeon]|nr:hypothetical protein [Theionarchaea archaeon]
MKVKSVILLSMLLVLSVPASVSAFVPVPIPPPLPPPPPPSISQPPNSNSMMAPLAQTTLNSVLSSQEKAHDLLDQATEQELDVEAIANSISEADALVEKAKLIVRSNPIAALNMLREAAEIYEKAISDLEELLS